MSQKGLAPLLIVIILAAVVGGYLVYQKQTKPPSTPTQSTQTTQPSPTQQAAPKPSPTPTSVIKKSPPPKSTATPSPSPSPSVSPSPTTKPSPIPGVYKLNLQPTSDIQMSTSSQGYIATILLTDSNGDTVYDQSDFYFSASIDNDIATISLLREENGYCKLNKIKSATSGYEHGICPNFVLSIDYKGGSFQAGSAKIPVKAIQKSTGKVVAEGAYSLTIK